MSSDKVFLTIGVSLAILLLHAALASSDDGVSVSRLQDPYYLVQWSPMPKITPLKQRLPPGRWRCEKRKQTAPNDRTDN
jgi:hypothetical protein